MTVTATRIPTVSDIRDIARQAGATTTHVLDAIAWAAASHAAEYVTKDWDYRLQRTTELVRNVAHWRIVEDADFYDFDIDNGYTFDELPPVIASHITLHAAVAAAH